MGGHVAEPKTGLSCWETRMKVVRFERCLSAIAPTYVHADLQHVREDDITTPLIIVHATRRGLQGSRRA